ncbi:xylosidase : arabinofuranosidase [Apiospora hydei]|uniref:Xylosidase: arabinofuranosidase n=1 Tax=Apiospora hydei TaxID=1337664 RepID=A0ABR1VJ21_9PEZI
MILSARSLLALVPLLHLSNAASNVTTPMRSYNNPILPGWHSDPSCVFVAEGAYNNTAFCTTSTFMAFPGNPLYASRDLTTWKLASHSLNRAAQFPEIRTATNQQFAGMFANTLRYHGGVFYLISAWINTAVELPRFVLFTTTDPYDDAAWSDGLFVETPTRTIDPDIFFDDEGDGSVVMASSGNPIIARRLNVTTGKTSESWALWNGTGTGSTEGPHLYRKDGWYYLLVAEGGTQLDHSATLARSRTLATNATWEPCPSNPLVSNSGTDSYFQTVGHADLFQDGAGNWWGIALSTRGGPELYNDLIFPMGRETVLYPVSWPAGEWPVAEQVRGNMSGPLPASVGAVTEGVGPVVGEADTADFAAGTSIPYNWIYWRAPFDPNTFSISDEDHPNTLRIAASRANLTADAAFNASIEGLSALFRRQEHSYFNFSVDLHLPPNGADRAEGDELGVSNFLNQDQHVDIGVVWLPPQEERNATSKRAATGLTPYFRVRANSVRYAPVPEPIIVPVPSAWLKDEDAVIRVRISPRNESHYEVFASHDDDDGQPLSLAVYTTALLSGDGAGTGGLLGVYATTNGGNQTFDAYFSRWRYEPVGQIIDYGVIVPSNGTALAV